VRTLIVYFFNFTNYNIIYFYQFSWVSKLWCKLQKILSKNREKGEVAKICFLGAAKNMEPVLETGPSEQDLGSSHLPARSPMPSKLDGAI
jgi:hypothetical protein